MKIRLYQNFLYILYSGLLVLAGFFFFYQRNLSGESLIYILGIDEINYINMSNGLDIDTFYLHKCRFFIPNILKALPFKAINELFIFNLISLIFLFYSSIKLTKEYLISDKIIFLNLLIFLSAFSVSYNFSNFYLLDVPSMTTIVFFLISIIRKSFFYALFWILISVLIRENAIIFLPIFYITFSKRFSLLSSLIILITYFLPKIIVSNGACITDIIDLEKVSALFESIFYIKGYLSYGSIWFLGMVGLFYFKHKNRHIYKVTMFFSLFSILGSFFSSMFSFSDITRMCILMLPSLFLGTSFFLNKIYNLKNSIYFLMLLIFCGFVLIANLIPNVLVNGNFNSLDNYIRSNYVIVTISLILQFFISIYLIKKYLNNKIIDQ